MSRRASEQINEIRFCSKCSEPKEVSKVKERFRVVSVNFQGTVEVMIDSFHPVLIRACDA